jgi:hypothetical protein
MLRISQCLDNQLIDGGMVVSPMHRPHLSPQKHYFFFSMFPVLISVYMIELPIYIQIQISVGTPLQGFSSFPLGNVGIVS